MIFKLGHRTLLSRPMHPLIPITSKALWNRRDIDTSLVSLPLHELHEHDIFLRWQHDLMNLTFSLINHSRNKNLIFINSFRYLMCNTFAWAFVTLLNDFSVPPSVTNLSDYDGDLSFMDDDIDEITFTNSNQNRRSLTGTSITSISRSISTLNQQNFEEIVKDDDGIFYFKEQQFAQDF